MESLSDKKLDHFLRNTDDEIARHRRQNFIDVIKQAEGKNPSDTAHTKIPGIENYYLDDTDTDVPRILDRHVPTHQFIKGPQTSNFHLPHMDDGPDLFFFLGKPRTTNRILCALQV